MGVESNRYVIVVGLQVTDDESYARYRAEMMPILSEYGGEFGYDFVVARVLKGDEQINRVFTISFPDRAARERFFSDERYQAVRAEHFESAVGSVFTLAELEEVGG